MQDLLTEIKEARGNAYWAAFVWIINHLAVIVTVIYATANDWLSSQSYTQKGMAVLLVAVICLWFIGVLVWINSRIRGGKNISDSNEELQAQVSSGHETIVEFGMPEDHAGESYLVWYHIPIDVRGTQSLERCDATLVEESDRHISKTALALLIRDSFGPAVRNMTLDPGRGLYYVPLFRRDELEQWKGAWICDQQSYNKSGTGYPGGNMLPPGSEGDFRLRLTWSNGRAYSYVFKVKILYKDINNGKLQIIPKINWKAKPQTTIQ
jgi:hypothetical protein